MEFKWTQGCSEIFEDAAIVRETVFCNEQGYAKELDIDEIDSIAWHLIGYINAAPVCTARLFGQANKAMHIGRVAVLKKCRGKGFGRRIMEMIEEKARQLCANSIELNAQVPSSGFYTALGYEKQGEIFLEEGQPHIKMAKSF